MSDPFKPGPNNNPFSEQKGQEARAGTQAAQERDRRLFEEEQARRRREEEDWRRANEQSQASRSASAQSSAKPTGKTQSASRFNAQASRGSSGNRKAAAARSSAKGDGSSTGPIDGLIAVAGAVAGGYGANIMAPGEGGFLAAGAVIGGGVAWAARKWVKVLAGVGLAGWIGWMIFQSQSSSGGGSSIAAAPAARAPAPVVQSAAVASPVDTAGGRYLPAARTAEDMFDWPIVTMQNYQPFDCNVLFSAFDVAHDARAQLKQPGKTRGYRTGGAPLHSLTPLDDRDRGNYPLKRNPLPDAACHFYGSTGWLICSAKGDADVFARRQNDAEACFARRGIRVEREIETEHDELSYDEDVTYRFEDGRILQLGWSRYDSADFLSVSVGPAREAN